MREFAGEPRVQIGFASETGLRHVNEDFVGAVIGGPGGDERRDVVVAVADGIGGAKGGRIAAETAVRGFLDGIWEVPETIEVRWASARILEALNRWIHAQGSQDPSLKGMGCTFTALVLRGRSAHVVHVGDSRAYRLSGDHLTRLTDDHLREGPNGAQLLYRAMGIEPELRLDYGEQPLAAYEGPLGASSGSSGLGRRSCRAGARRLAVRALPRRDRGYGQSRRPRDLGDHDTWGDLSRAGASGARSRLSPRDRPNHEE